MTPVYDSSLPWVTQPEYGVYHRWDPETQQWTEHLVVQTPSSVVITNVGSMMSAEELAEAISKAWKRMTQGDGAL